MAELLQIRDTKASDGDSFPRRAGAVAAFSRQGGRPLQSRWWHGIIQVPTLVVFLVIFYAAFFGPADPRRNFATVTSWIIWWPLLAVTYSLFCIPRCCCGCEGVTSCSHDDPVTFRL